MKLSKTKLEEAKRVIDAYFENGFSKLDAVLAIFPHKSKSAANVYFNRLEKNPDVVAYIDEKHSSIIDRSEETLQALIQYYGNILTSDFTKGMHMTVKEFQEDLPEEMRKMVTGYEVIQKIDKDTGTPMIVGYKVKFFSKEEAARQLSKYSGLEGNLADSNNSQPQKLIIGYDRKPT